MLWTKYALPGDRAQLATLLRLYVGAVGGYLVSPLLWVLYPGLLGWLRHVALNAAAESAYGQFRSGDGGDSVGALHFNIRTGRVLVGDGWADTLRSDVWAGFYAARYVQQALLNDWRWWSIGIPVIGDSLIRYAWTHGISEDEAKSATSGAASTAFAASSEAVARRAATPLAVIAASIFLLVALVVWGVRRK